MAQSLQYQKRDLSFARAFAEAEKHHLMTFSDGANSADHLIRVVELENAERQLSKKLAQF